MAIMLILIGLMVYNYVINHYLIDLHQPLLIKIGFWLSLLIAMYHEIKVSYQYSLVNIGAIVILFIISVTFANVLRFEYIGLTYEVSHTPEIMTLIGTDVLEMCRNRVIGYGGCFALGVLIIRITLYKLVTEAFVKWFVDQQYRPEVCSHCQQVRLKA